MAISRYARATESCSSVRKTRPRRRHSLPIAYVLAVLDGNEPVSRVPIVANATAYRLGAPELEAAVGAFDRWLAAPTF